MFVFFGIGIGIGQNKKLVDLWSFPEYDDDIFETSFIDEQLKKNLLSDEFTPYFFANENDWKDVLESTYDENGIVIRKSDSVYFPTLIIRTALTSYYQYAKTGEKKAEEIFLAHSEWLKDNLYIIGEKYGFWVFTNYSESYKLKPGWTSAMSQGMGVGVCLMAYRLTKDNEYLNVVDLALKGFYVPIEYGGFKRDFNGGLWFEEYPTKTPSYTLNGFIFGIAGLYNFYQNSNNKQIKDLFDESQNTLLKNLEAFKGSFTSYYSKKRPFYFAKDSYHKIHILQLAWMHEVTEEEKYLELSKSFLDVHINNVALNKGLRFKKIKSIKANNCINCEEFGVDHLADDKWSWGGYWSSYKNPELYIDFGKKRKVKSIILYGINVRSVLFEMEVCDIFTDELIETIPYGKTLENISYITTGNYETYIRKIELSEEVDIEGIKIKFKGTDRKKVLALREIQCEISMDEEFEIIQNWIMAKEDL